MTPTAFWDRLDRSGDCWTWPGARRDRGYGTVVIDHRQRSTHRLAWELTFGPIPAGLFVCHSCDNPPCCRPDHLWLGTAAENAQDAKAKGRLRSWASDPSGRPSGSTGLTRPIYRLRSRGRIEVLTARGNWQRKALIPPNGIQVADAPLTESELRWLHGDR